MRRGYRNLFKWLIVVFVLTFLSGTVYALSQGSLGVTGTVSFSQQPSPPPPVFGPPVSVTPAAISITHP